MGYFPDNLSTDAKRSAFSTNLLADTSKAKRNYDKQQHKNLNNHSTKLLAYTQTKANKTDQVHSTVPGAYTWGTAKWKNV